MHFHFSCTFNWLKLQSTRRDDMHLNVFYNFAFVGGIFAPNKCFKIFLNLTLLKELINFHFIVHKFYLVREWQQKWPQTKMATNGLKHLVFVFFFRIERSDYKFYWSISLCNSKLPPSFDFRYLLAILFFIDGFIV